MTDTDADWRLQALCYGVGAGWFIPSRRPVVPPPVVTTLCPTCPVRADCEDYGRSTRSDGWWGGRFLIEGVPQVVPRRKKVCDKGHPLVGRNVIHDTEVINGVTYDHRKCRKCAYARDTTYKRRKTAAKTPLPKRQCVYCGREYQPRRKDARFCCAEHGTAWHNAQQSRTARGYVHHQSTPAATWVIDHNLGWYPNVTVIDSDLTQVEGDITQISTDTMRLEFCIAVSGTAYLS